MSMDLATRPWVPGIKNIPHLGSVGAMASSSTQSMRDSSRQVSMTHIGLLWQLIPDDQERADQPGPHVAWYFRKLGNPVENGDFDLSVRRRG